MATQTLPADTCSKCAGPMDLMVQSGTAKWCKACRKKYEKEYKTVRARQFEVKAFRAGSDAQLRQIVSRFALAPMAMFRGKEIIDFLREMEAPELPAPATVEAED